MSLRIAKRLDVLQRDTRELADELDRLAYVTSPPDRWDGSDPQKLATATLSDSTGYHKALASLEGFSRRVEKMQQTSSAPQK